MTTLIKAPDAGRGGYLTSIGKHTYVKSKPNMEYQKNHEENTL